MFPIQCKHMTRPSGEIYCVEFWTLDSYLIRSCLFWQLRWQLTWSVGSSLLFPFTHIIGVGHCQWWLYITTTINMVTKPRMLSRQKSPKKTKLFFISYHEWLGHCCSWANVPDWLLSLEMVGELPSDKISGCFMRGTFLCRDNSNSLIVLYFCY